MEHENKEDFRQENDRWPWANPAPLKKLKLYHAVTIKRKHNFLSPSLCALIKLDLFLSKE